MSDKRASVGPSNLKSPTRAVTDPFMSKGTGLSLDSTLEVLKDMTVTGDLTVSGSSEITGSEQVDGALHVNGAVTAGTNAATAHVLTGDLNVTDDLDVDGDLNVDGGAQIDGAITAGTNAATAHVLTGDLEITDDLHVDSDAQIDGNFVATGTIKGSSIGVAGTEATIPMKTIDSAALAAQQYQALAHGLGVIPERWETTLLCISAEVGFSVNDEVHVGSFYDSGSYHSIVQVTADATNFTIMTGSSLALIHKTNIATGLQNLDETKWKVRIRYGL